MRALEQGQGKSQLDDIPKPDHSRKKQRKGDGGGAGTAESYDPPLRIDHPKYGTHYLVSPSDPLYESFVRDGLEITAYLVGVSMSLITAAA